VDFGLTPSVVECSRFSPVSIKLGQVLGLLQPNTGQKNLSNSNIFLLEPGQKISVVATVFALSVPKNGTSSNSFCFDLAKKTSVAPAFFPSAGPKT